MEKTAMRLNVIDKVSEPCGKTNEDLFDHNDQAAWIFDGASGIGPKTIASAPTDPYWLVQTMNASLKQVWKNETSTPVLLRAAAEETISRYKEAVGGTVPELIDRPTACLTMARLWQGKLQLSSVGDCWTIWRTGNQVGDSGFKHDEIAKPVRQERARLFAEGIAAPEIQKRLWPLEREFRMKGNIDGGYPIVDLTTRWIDRMRIRTLDVSPGDRLLLMTDGLYRLVDTMRTYDPSSLLQAAESKGLMPLYKELRTLEKADEACKLYPRTKLYDDVAAALITIQP